MPYQYHNSKWHGVSPQQRADIFSKLDNNNLLEVIQGLSSSQCEKIPASAEAIIQELKNPSQNSGRKPTKIILFTDLGRDIDDAALVVVLAYLHRIRVIEVLLAVTNVKPTESRARAAKFLFEKMGAPDVPVARGSDGTSEDVELHHYEFEGIGEPQGTILNGRAA